MKKVYTDDGTTPFVNDVDALHVELMSARAISLLTWDFIVKNNLILKLNGGVSTYQFVDSMSVKRTSKKDKYLRAMLTVSRVKVRHVGGIKPERHSDAVA